MRRVSVGLLKKPAKPQMLIIKQKAQLSLVTSLISVKYLQQQQQRNFV